MDVLKRQRSRLADGSRADFVGEVLLSPFMCYLLNVFEGPQDASKLGKRIQK